MERLIRVWDLKDFTQKVKIKLKKKKNQLIKSQKTPLSQSETQQSLKMQKKQYTNVHTLASTLCGTLFNIQH